MTKFHAAWYEVFPRTRRRKRSIPPYFASTSVKIVTVKHIYTLLIITSTGNELLNSVNINDLDWPRTPKIGGFNEFFAISRVNCADMAGDRPRQPAYEIFSTECRLQLFKSRKYVQRGLRTRVSKGVPRYKVVIFPLLACLSWKRLQLGTDMLLITTRFLVVSILMTLNDLEPPKLGF